METIWTNSHSPNGRNGHIESIVAEGLIFAKKMDHERAFELFKQAYLGINWDSPTEDSEIKFNALRLVGHAGFKSRNFKEAQFFFFRRWKWAKDFFQNRKERKRGEYTIGCLNVELS